MVHEDCPGKHCASRRSSNRLSVIMRQPAATSLRFGAVCPGHRLDGGRLTRDFQPIPFTNTRTSLMRRGDSGRATLAIVTEGRFIFQVM